jgi:hypothetical protein
MKQKVYDIWINPFYYGKILSDYNSIISKYESSIQNYRNAGEKGMRDKFL